MFLSVNLSNMEYIPFSMDTTSMGLIRLQISVNVTTSENKIETLSNIWKRLLELKRNDFNIFTAIKLDTDMFDPFQFTYGFVTQYFLNVCIIFLVAHKRGKMWKKYLNLIWHRLIWLSDLVIIAVFWIIIVTKGLCVTSTFLIEVRGIVLKLKGIRT